MCFEWIAKRRLEDFLLLIGVISGLVAGLIPYRIAIAPFQSSSDYWALFAFAGLGIFLGLIAFGFQWVANKLMSILPNSKSPGHKRLWSENDDQA
jgi:H+/Cl- antiporter ClcA